MKKIIVKEFRGEDSSKLRRDNYHILARYKMALLVQKFERPIRAVSPVFRVHLDRS